MTDRKRPGSMQRIVIVGGGLAAARCCTQLRTQGFDGAVTVLSEESLPPYDRPPLSKAVLLGVHDDTAFSLDYAELGVDVCLGAAALGVDVQRRVIRSEDVEYPFDGLVIATGAAPVTLPGTGPQWILRTMGDALRLRDRLVPGARVAIIGASWIGAEIASAAVQRGCSVSCVEAGPAPLAQTLGEQVGRRTLTWWEDVDLRTDTKVAAVDDDGLCLADGVKIPADTVVTGVGVQPATAWLRGSGIDVDGGVLVDSLLRTNVPGVVALGDVAAYVSERFRTRIRVEHWMNATEGASVAVASLLGRHLVHDPVPYFWSDQFGRKVQYFGHHRTEDRLVWRESDDERRWAAAWLDPDDRLTAFVAASKAKDAIQAGRLIDEQVRVDPAALADPQTPVAQCGRA